MRLHGNARTCPHSRRLAVRRLEQGWTLARAAEAAGVSVRTISKWRRRYRREGEQGLLDRSSAPAWIPHRTPEERVQAIEWSIALGAGAAWVSTGLGLQRIAVGSAGAMLVSPRNNSLAVYSDGPRVVPRLLGLPARLAANRQHLRRPRDRAANPGLAVDRSSPIQHSETAQAQPPLSAARLRCLSPQSSP